MRWAASPQQSALAVQAFGLQRSFELVVVTFKILYIDKEECLKMIYDFQMGGKIFN